MSDRSPRRTQIRVSIAVLGTVLLTGAVAPVSNASGGTPSAPPNAKTHGTEPSTAVAATAQSARPVGPRAGQRLMTVDEAIASVRGTSTAHASAKLMRYADAAKLIDEGANPLLSPDTQVYVVTVYQAPDVAAGLWPPFRPLPSPGALKGITAIIDAVNGGFIDSCIGCTALP